jgi:hypothetical protein
MFNSLSLAIFPLPRRQYLQGSQLRKSMRYLSALTCLIIFTASISAEPITDKASPLFDPTKIHEIHIEVSAQGWKTMEPKIYSIFSPLFASPPATRPTTGPTTRPKYIEGQRLDPNLNGFEYAFVKAQISLDGETVHDVGLRMKGNSSYASAEKTLHVPLKIDFNRFVPGQHFHGLATINLHNNAFDNSQMREHLTYAIFREAGLPASRTAYAKVFLTIPGKYDHKEIGLYSIVEEVDKEFIKSRFPSTKGLLMKPETISFGLRDLGDDWKDYIRQYQPRWEATPKQARRVIELVQLFENADDQTFQISHRVISQRRSIPPPPGCPHHHLQPRQHPLRRPQLLPLSQSHRRQILFHPLGSEPFVCRLGLAWFTGGFDQPQHHPPSCF